MEDDEARINYEATPSQLCKLSTYSAYITQNTP
jgi:hypothetical protein